MNINKLFWVGRKIREFFYVVHNKLLFSLSGVKYGKNLVVKNHVLLKNFSDSSIKIGDNCTIISGDGINPLSRNIKCMIFADHNSEIIIGNNVGISSASIRSKQKIVIGNNVKIGADSIIIDNDGHSLDYRYRNRSSFDDRMHTKSSPVYIEDDVLVGTRCIILKGVTIGKRSIIAAGSVVTKNIPCGEIWGGNPAIFIKKIQNE